MAENLKLSRRRYGKLVVGGARRRWGGGSFGSGPTTPILRWKIDDGHGEFSGAGGCSPVAGRKWLNFQRGGGVPHVSARKLGKGLWRFAAMAEGVSCGDGAGGAGHRGGDGWQCGRLSRLGIKFQSSLSIPKWAREESTKWDAGYSKASGKLHCSYSRMKLLDDQDVATIAGAFPVQAEIRKAHNRIKELETEVWNYKKKLKLFLRKLKEERASWMRRELQEMRTVTDGLRDELKRERRNCRRMNIVNSRLINELADAKLSVRQVTQDYEKERKARELLEGVCSELTKEIEDDKIEIKSLKSECTKIRENVEQESKMLQLAEVWREERVQMKLVDAKLLLEEKYSQMNSLIAELEAILKSRNENLDANRAKSMKKYLCAMKTEDMRQLSYTPPKSNDIYSVVKEIQTIEARKRGDQSVCDSPTNRSEINNGGPENGFTRDAVCKHANHLTDYNRANEDASGKETVTQAEDHCLSHSVGGSENSVNKMSGSKCRSTGKKEHDPHADPEPLNSESIAISTVSAKLSKKKGSSFSKLWKPLPSNDEIYKAVSIVGKGRFFIKSNSKAASPKRMLGGVAKMNRHNLVRQWCSSGVRNPHIARAMKGCIEWPRGIQKNGLKAKLLEARLESQKLQLHTALKQMS